MIYVPKHFSVKELVPKHFYETWGELSLQFLDAGLLHDLDVIREAAGQPLYINTWSFGGGYNWSGLRTPEYSNYSPTSLHSFGEAYDIKLKAWMDGKDLHLVEEVQGMIIWLKGEGKLEYVTGMETGTESWCHIDGRNRFPNTKFELFMFNK